MTWLLGSGGSLAALSPNEEEAQAGAARGDIVVALTDHPAAPPPWQSFIREALPAPDFGGTTGVQGAIIFCRCADPREASLRWIAFTFGSGSQSVRRQSVSPRFGLIAALNRLARTASSTAMLRQAGYRALGPYTYQAGYRAARDTPLDSFRIDRVADLLSAVGGQAGEDHDPVFGSRSLKIRHDIGSFDDFVDVGEAALVDFRQLHYRREFAFVDSIIPVEDESVVQSLRQQLQDGVVRVDPAIDVLLPDDLVPYEDERSIVYIARPRHAANRASDLMLTLEMVAQIVEADPVRGLDAVFRFLDADRNVIAQCPMLDCLAAELSIENRRFVLYDGDFYEVAGGLLDRVNDQAREVPVSALELPRYRGGDEADWNQAVADRHPDRFVVLDGRFIRLPGESPFEACDLFGFDHVLIHAKRKSRSSTMSHLFVQAQRSSQLLLELDAARAQLEGLLGESGVATPIAQSLCGSLTEPWEWTIVLALLGDWHQRGLANLPLLTKISLITAVDAIRRLGFTVEVALVTLHSR